MSVLVLYAVVLAGRLPPPAGATGGGLPRLSVLSEGPVAVLYEEREEAPAADRPELLAFARTAQAVAADGPALPVRFGTVLDDLEDLRRLLRERGDGWQERLSYVDGHVEVVVHASDEQAPRPTPASKGGSGRDYLMSRAAARLHTETMHDELAAALGAHCREIRRLPGEDEVRLACLLASGDTDKLRSTLESWAGAQEGRAARTTGPWPPFTFAEEDRP
jgi:Gas vesicle synthesis protein GvpL/GvpF